MFYDIELVFLRIVPGAPGKGYSMSFLAVFGFVLSREKSKLSLFGGLFLEFFSVKVKRGSEDQGNCCISKDLSSIEVSTCLF